MSAASDGSALRRLEEIGFDLAGEWLLDDGEPCIEVRRLAAASNVLYAFASERELLYIGRAGRTLAQRMRGYEIGGPPRSARSRNRERIIAMLMLDQPVTLHAMPDPGSLLYGSFRVNIAAGLQHSLITALDPAWNRPMPLHGEGDPTPRNVVTAAARRRRRAHLPGDPDASLTSTDRPSYRFLVGYMYMDKGFFNVPVRYSRLFGADRERIRILCGSEKATIHGRIDRSSNTNAAPRIIGGGPLKHWFEEHAGLNNPVDIDILAPNAVWIRNPGTRFD